MSIAYVQWHVPKGDAHKERAKLIGVYSSLEAANAAVERLAGRPGFVDHPQGFEVSAYGIDQDYWTEGFGID